MWKDLVALFMSGQAGKALQQSLEREIKSLQLDHNWTRPYLTFYNAVNGKLVDLRMLTTHIIHPDSWCIQNVNECYQPNTQMQAFISNLEATTTQVHAMAGAIAATAGGTTQLALPALMYEGHMSNIQEHSIVIDMEHVVTMADKNMFKPFKRQNMSSWRLTMSILQAEE